MTTNIKDLEKRALECTTAYDALLVLLATNQPDIMRGRKQMLNAAASIAIARDRVARAIGKLTPDKP